MPEISSPCIPGLEFDTNHKFIDFDQVPYPRSSLDDRLVYKPPLFNPKIESLWEFLNGQRFEDYINIKFGIWHDDEEVRYGNRFRAIFHTLPASKHSFLTSHLRNLKIDLNFDKLNKAEFDKLLLSIASLVDQDNVIERFDKLNRYNRATKQRFRGPNESIESYIIRVRDPLLEIMTIEEAENNKYLNYLLNLNFINGLIDRESFLTFDEIMII